MEKTRRNITQLCTLLIILIMGFMMQQFSPVVFMRIEILLLAIGVLLTGIPHGALDHLVARKKAVIESKPFSWYKFFSSYLLWMVLYALLWWISPAISLLLFLLLTAWHFGETDIQFFKPSAKFTSLSNIVYGISLTALLLLNHPADLKYWLELILNGSNVADAWVDKCAQVPWFVWLAVLLLISFPRNNAVEKKYYSWALLMLLIALCSQLSLLGGFAIYFAGWHGVRALFDIQEFIAPSKGWWPVWKKAIPFTLLSISFLAFAYWLGPAAWINSYGLPAIFILLSVLTLPHAQVMHSLYLSRNPTVFTKNSPPHSNPS